MSSTAALIAFLLAFALTLASPGPSFALLLGTGLRGGRKAALKVAIGIGLGDLFWGVLSVVGVATLTGSYPWITTAVQVGGGVFLLYFAASCLRAAFRGNGAAGGAAVEDDGAARRGVATGFGLTALNAKAGVFWLSLTGLLLGADMPWIIPVLAVGIATVMSIAWHCLLACAFTTPAVATAYTRFKRYVEATLGAILGALGLKLLMAW